MRGIVGRAADQAVYFQSKNAFLQPGGNPNPGDFIFFRNTVPGQNGITHVGIYLGRYRDGTLLIIQASSRAGRVIFDKLRPDSSLTKKIAGYGDISILTPAQ